MRKVMDYGLKMLDRETIKLPKGAILMQVAMGGDNPILWAMIDDQEQEIVPRRIRKLKSGIPNPLDMSNWRHLGSIFVPTFAESHHFYEEPEPVVAIPTKQEEPAVKPEA